MNFPRVLLVGGLLLAGMLAHAEHFMFQSAWEADWHGALGTRTLRSLRHPLAFDRLNGRPGDKTIDRHEAAGLAAGANSLSPAVDVRAGARASCNPECLLRGAPLSRGLVRHENLWRVASGRPVFPERRSFAEDCRPDVFSGKCGKPEEGPSANRMTDVDQACATEFSTAPRLKVPLKSVCPGASLLSSSFVQPPDDISDWLRFTDRKGNRIFVADRHRVTALLVASGVLAGEARVSESHRRQRPTEGNDGRVGAAVGAWR